MTFECPPSWLRPAWAEPLPQVGAVMTDRLAEGEGEGEAAAGAEAAQAPYAAFNLGDHVGDDLQAVLGRREQLALALGVQPVWLKQVHGARVVRLSWSAVMPGGVLADGEPVGVEPIEADGAWTTEPNLACTVMVADCLPVLLAGPDGGVAALHAGWRGLCGAGPEMAGQGVIEQGVARLTEALACRPDQLQAWLGPCIWPQAFEVGADVLAAFDPADQAWFAPHPTSAGKWLADLPALARARLRRLGVTRVTGGQWCTFSDESRFYSFRRHAVTGRQAALIWRCVQVG
jgi:YfiH family protein